MYKRSEDVLAEQDERPSRRSTDLLRQHLRKVSSSVLTERKLSRDVSSSQGERRRKVTSSLRQTSSCRDDRDNRPPSADPRSLLEELQDAKRERMAFACRVLHELQSITGADSMVSSQDSFGKGRSTFAKWQERCDLPKSLEFPCCVEWDGEIVVGGHSEEDAACALLCYDANSDTWSELEVPSDWIRIGGLFVYHGHLHVLADDDVAYPAKIYRLDIKDDLIDGWTCLCTLPKSHYLGTCCLVGHQLVIAGGLSSDDEPTGTSSVDIYNMASQAWTVWPNLNKRHCLNACLNINDKEVMVLSGHSESQSSIAAETIDPSHPVCWKTVASLPQAGNGFAAFGDILFRAGGWLNDSITTEPSASVSVSFDDVVKDESSSFNWLGLPSMMKARAYPAVITNANRQVFVIGGAKVTANGSFAWTPFVECLQVP